MTSFLNITLFILMILVTQNAYAQKRTCDYIKKPPLKVNINLSLPEATYDFGRSMDELTADGFENTVEWLQKQGIKSVGIARHLGQFYNIRGVLSGGYAYSLNYRMQAKHVDNYGVYYCPYLTEINLELFYASKVFIAKELEKNSCEFDEVMKHEWKHHTANVVAIQTYSERLKKDLPVIARDIEHRFGYVERTSVEPTFEEIKVAVGDMIDVYYDSIWRDSRKRNADIDTPYEYNRVNLAIDDCKKERKEEKIALEKAVAEKEAAKLKQEAALKKTPKNAMNE